jgi:hypothetical protein
VIVCSGHQSQVNSLVKNCRLKGLGCLADLRPRVLIQTRQNMRRACNNSHAVAREFLGHGQRHVEILRTIIDTRQQVAMQIDHKNWRSASLKTYCRLAYFSPPAASPAKKLKPCNLKLNPKKSRTRPGDNEKPPNTRTMAELWTNSQYEPFVEGIGLWYLH